MAEANERKWEILYQYGDNFTELAQAGKLDPMIGRENELEQVIEILCSRRKNNPVLVGEAGVGKTAIVEGLAQRIVEGDVPKKLQGRQLFAIDLARIVARASEPGAFEAIIKEIFSTIAASNGEILSFVDEVHMLTTAKGTLNATDILKPALARGDLHLIGATTLDEYREIEKDPALERRFQPVMIYQPSVEETVTILERIKDHYEAHFGVRVAQDALEACALFSDRYIQNRQLPDKAIDLLDVACARRAIVVDSEPPLLAELRRQIGLLESKLRKHEDRTDEEARRLVGKGKERLTALRAELAEKAAQAQAERDICALWGQAKSRWLAAQKERRQLAKRGPSERLRQLEEEVLPEIQRELERIEGEWAAYEARGLVLGGVVRSEHIAELIHRKTGIPAENIMLDERKLLMKLEENLNSRIIGQETAIKAISEAVIRSRTGITDPDKPRGSFMFLGASGSGKTELAYVMADVLLHDREALIRVNMNEYQEKATLARLMEIMLRAVRKHPYCVLLLDEIEKADTAILDILLQILGYGIIMDERGRIVSFRNAYIVMTCNLEIFITANSGNLKSRDILYRHLNRHFRPEFINKIDELVFFTPLTQGHLARIARLQLQEVIDALAARSVTLSVSDGACAYLGRASHNPEYGAHELNRILKNEVKTPLAMLLLRDQLPAGSEVKALAVEELPLEERGEGARDRLTFKITTPPPAQDEQSRKTKKKEKKP